MDMVYVLNKDGKPLMATTRGGRVRYLLKEKKARVVSSTPFTIQLNYDTPDITQDLILGIDPGRTNIGVAVVKEDGQCVFSAHLETRNKDVPLLMKKRAAFRRNHRTLDRRRKRQRRAKAAGTTIADGSAERLLPGYEKPIVCHYIRNKKARFNNRCRPAGWLTPTANHLLQTHINLIAKVAKFLPITKVVVELNRFAFMAMDNPNIRRWEYQQGPLYGLGSVEDAVYAQQDGRCLFCKKPIDHYHHVVPRRKNGSETLANRCGLCAKHHALVHTDKAWAGKLVTQKEGMNKKYHALSVLNQIIPSLMEYLGDEMLYDVYATDGRSTKGFRIAKNVPKEHYTDAYCIACSILDTNIKVSAPVEPFELKQFRRHDRQACHQQRVDRKYYLDGKQVATNRHKAIEQKSNSLEEFRETYGDAAVSQLTVKPHPPQYKDMTRIMPGAVMNFCGAVGILLGSDGFHNGKPDYYKSTKEERVRMRRCALLAQNAGMVFIPA